MKVIETGFEGLFLLEPRLFRDKRGYFYESFNSSSFQAVTGFEKHFVQDNHSLSYRGVLRGLHFQYGAHAQAKLIRVLNGTVLDVAVDLREGSRTFGQHFKAVLSAENKRQFFIPHGFAHGFAVLSEHAEMLYKTDSFYSPEFQSGIRYDDPALQIDWGLPASELVLSDRDLDLPGFEAAAKLVNGHG